VKCAADVCGSVLAITWTRQCLVVELTADSGRFSKKNLVLTSPLTAAILRPPQHRQVAGYANSIYYNIDIGDFTTPIR